MTNPEVTQAARDAAADFMEHKCLPGDLTPTNIRLGNLDDGLAVQAFARHRQQAEPVAEIERLREENERLRKMLVPQWFYADGYSSEDCNDSPHEVIEYLDLKPGKHVVSVDCAGPMPSIWCAVTVLTDEQMDEQETDDRVAFTEHASEDQARAALGERP